MTAESEETAMPGPEYPPLPDPVLGDRVAI